MMAEKTYKDGNRSFDYVAEVLNPTMREDKRLALAELCMTAYFLEGGCSLMNFRPKAAYIIEQLAIRLMGAAWTKEWLDNYDVRKVSREPPSPDGDYFMLCTATDPAA